MLRRVSTYIRQRGLLSKEQPVLVAISGGADSVALLDVLLRAGYRCIAAHCNFHLRGEESNRDEAFVRDLCTKMEVPLEVKEFNTPGYAAEKHVGIEVAARELRYAWFDETAQANGCQAVAVAHHQNDQAETILMNIRRGCGLKGLQGMSPKSRNPYSEVPVPVVRPLLCTTHDYICHYLRDIRGLAWVEDSTNSDTNYKRNAVREELRSWSKAEIEHLVTIGERI